MKNQKYLTKRTRQSLKTSSSDVHKVNSSLFLDGEKEVVGIVTLENVIERILLTDIKDEKDIMAAKQL